MPSFRQTDVENPHFQLPFRFGGVNGAAFVNEQDSIEDIEQCIKTVLAYPIGSRAEVPTFGVPDVVFKTQGAQQGVPDQLKTAILVWENRAQLAIDGQPVMTDAFLQGIVSKLGASSA